MKCALDIGNSSVKGMLLTDTNEVISPLRFPSSVVTVADAKYLTYTNPEDVYIQVIDSPLAHVDDIVAVGQKAIDMPDYREYDVTSTSYKANHEITTSLLFGALVPFIETDAENVALAVSVPIVEAKSIGLIEDYKTLLTGSHVVRLYTEAGTRDITINFTTVAVLNEGQAGFLGLLDTVDRDFRSDIDAVYNSMGETDPVADLEDFLIVDIGEGTTDLAVFRNKRFNPEYSYSITRGYGNLLEDAMSAAAREHLTIESRKDLQKVLESTNKRRAERREKWMEYVAPTKDKFIEVVTDTILKTYGKRDYFDAIIFIGGGFTALTGYRVDLGQVQMNDTALFDTLHEKLEKNHKAVDLLFGVPAPYAQGINERGLTQVLTNMQ
jgi:hypothetical protein